MAALDVEGPESSSEAFAFSISKSREMSPAFSSISFSGFFLEAFGFAGALTGALVGLAGFAAVLALTCSIEPRQ